MTNDLCVLIDNWFYYRQGIRQLLENKEFKEEGERRPILYFQAIFEYLNFDREAINMKIPQLMKDKYKERSFKRRPTVSKLMASTKMKNKANIMIMDLSFPAFSGIFENFVSKA